MTGLGWGHLSRLGWNAEAGGGGIRVAQDWGAGIHLFQLGLQLWPGGLDPAALAAGSLLSVLHIGFHARCGGGGRSRAGGGAE